MLSESYNQLKKNFTQLVGLTFCIIAVLFTINITCSVDSFMLKYMILSIALIILVTILLKFSLKISSSNEKIELKEILSKSTIKNIVDMLKAYLLIGVISYFAVIAIVIIVIMAVFILMAGDLSSVGPIHFPIAIFLMNFLPLFIFLKITFIPFSILDESLEGFSFIQRIKFGYKISKGYLLEIIGLYISSALLTVGGLLCFVLGVLVSTALISLIFGNTYVNARDNYLYNM